MITKDDIKYLEGLIKINLTEEKREQYTKEIDEILEYIKEISSVDLGTSKDQEYQHNNIFKSDAVLQDDNHRDLALDNAPEKLGKLYKVSQVLKQ
ncbi:MAG: Aspartyl/glutamyl-tRNA(Asn/Gln) amidotransferase subunit [Patescibacteria group bacterium]|nr:Aspartyl/glutamyl-tRNA(Asn/Gln) amidotransferase subunit [Patescibacteria group bacterium]